MDEDEKKIDSSSAPPKEEQEEFEYVKEKIVKPSLFVRLRNKSKMVIIAVLSIAVLILGIMYLVERRKNHAEQFTSESYIAIIQETTTVQPTTTVAVTTTTKESGRETEQTEKTQKESSSSEKETMKPEENTTHEPPESTTLEDTKEELSKKKLTALCKRLKKTLITIRTYEDPEVDVGQKPATITTGAIIRKGVNILILTDYSSVYGAERIDVSFGDDQVLNGTFKSGDSELGLAVISVSGTDIDKKTEKKIRESILAGPVPVVEGIQLIYMGTPIDKSIYIDYGTVTSLSSMTYTDGQIDTIQTNIPQAGASNGFIFNNQGDLIGIINASVQQDAKVCVAARISQLMPVMERLVNGMSRSWLGIQGETVTDEIISQVSKDMPYGVYVHEVKKNSPAYFGGIRNGDIITQIGGTEVWDMEDIRDILYEVSPGDSVTVTVERQDVKKYVKHLLDVEVDAVN